MAFTSSGSHHARISARPCSADTGGAPPPTFTALRQKVGQQAPDT
eukprot:CAMPEP_0204491722 /NCGR_PEP_ID=MMETSP0471-20130131/77945_1 /ASSEMBLY_ACC=CAM_ASM_000602 /TAXON_ID=2969 /ORGANISM="Oxyrrhis marina" /LENGTH=44 /DNA_ID= /DNA_START= /DNA_END= /DNA_ORIENTATION=